MANGISESQPIEIPSDGISRGRYPQLPCKKDLQQCLEIRLRPFLRFFKSVKADLEICYDKEIQGEGILTTMASPRGVEAGRG